MMPREDPNTLRNKLKDAAMEANKLKAMERAEATRMSEGKPPLAWHLLEVGERLAALGPAHQDVSMPLPRELGDTTSKESSIGKSRTENKL